MKCYEYSICLNMNIEYSKHFTTDSVTVMILTQNKHTKCNICRMREFISLLLFSVLVLDSVLSQEETPSERDGKVFGVFNVVTFPNSACAASNGYNGTCYTSSECTAKGGTASGTCASSFGVCCVFSISCGSSSSANNTYAIISSFSTSSGT